jgi:hypothetical protein
MATLWMSEPENVRGKRMLSASELSRLLVGKTPHSTQQCEQLYYMAPNMQFYILRLHSQQLEIHDY